MNIIFNFKLIIENYKWKFIPIKNYKLNEETIEKYSLIFTEKGSVIDIKKYNLIEFEFDLKDIKKKFLVFAIGLFNNQILFVNTIILFIINLENFIE